MHCNDLLWTLLQALAMWIFPIKPAGDGVRRMNILLTNISFCSTLSKNKRKETLQSKYVLFHILLPPPKPGKKFCFSTLLKQACFLALPPQLQCGQCRTDTDCRLFLVLQDDSDCTHVESCACWGEGPVQRGCNVLTHFNWTDQPGNFYFSHLSFAFINHTCPQMRVSS